MSGEYKTYRVTLIGLQHGVSIDHYFTAKEHLKELDSPKVTAFSRELALAVI